MSKPPEALLRPENSAATTALIWIQGHKFEEQRFPGDIFALYDPWTDAYIAVAQGENSPIRERFEDIANEVASSRS